MSLLALSTHPTNCGQDEDYNVLAYDVNVTIVNINSHYQTPVIKKLFHWDLTLLKFNVETFFQINGFFGASDMWKSK